jgi:hypothetical protein
MTLPRFREVKPQAAQRADGKWVSSPIITWEEHAKMSPEAFTKLGAEIIPDLGLERSR